MFRVKRWVFWGKRIRGGNVHIEQEKPIEFVDDPRQAYRDDKPKGKHAQGNVDEVKADYHPLWNELSPAAQIRWTLRFNDYATYTVPLGRLRDYLRRKRDDELSNWAWVRLSYVEWPEHWKRIQWT